MHNRYRDRFISLADVSPGLMAPRSFLMDLHHRYRNLWASPGGNGFSRPQKYEFRNAVSGLGDPLDRGRVEISLEKPDGAELKLPALSSGRMLGVIFAEPTTDPVSVSNLASRVNSFGSQFTKLGVEVVVACLSEDVDAVKALSAQLDDGLQIGILQNGLMNPLVVRLGVLCADRIPNVMLFRPDGSIAWMISGMHYKAYGDSGRTPHAIIYAIQRNIEKVRLDPGFEALDKGEYKEALKLFEKSSSVVEDGDWSAADRLQGAALAYVGLGNLDSALEKADAAIDQRFKDFRSGICKCHGLVEMYLTKAVILDKLGRGREAQMMRHKADSECIPHAKLPPGLARSGVPVGVYYDWLKKIRLGMKEGK